MLAEDSNRTRVSEIFFISYPRFLNMKILKEFIFPHRNSCIVILFFFLLFFFILLPSSRFYFKFRVFIWTPFERILIKDLGKEAADMPTRKDKFVIGVSIRKISCYVILIFFDSNKRGNKGSAKLHVASQSESLVQHMSQCSDCADDRIPVDPC